MLREKWAYSPTSSSASKVVAALKYFGLIELSQVAESEMVKVTDRAYRILVDTEESEERKQALRDAFLSPKAYKMCWDHWGVDVPQSARSTLIFNEGFIDSTVDGFLGNYKKSMLFAGLHGYEVAEKHVEEDRQDVSSAEKSASTNMKQLQLTHPSSGLDDQHARQQKPMVTPSGVAQKGVGMRQEVFALAEGDVTIQWPETLSPDSFQDFEDWLAILKRKIKRSVSDQVVVKSQGSDQDGDDLL
ncbi:hypothetical protein SDC9_93663 [bioreactor metagenome]|uniref:Uncharacterized protein n=1 Tax=bioreactor metagenome TaxID=1076179 RepID=A0A645A215_9ZZZZ